MKSFYLLLFSIFIYGATYSQGIAIGNDKVCLGELGVVYSVAPITNATDYIWTIPTGASIVGGDNSNTITVNFGSDAQSGNFTVQGSNNCGVGLPSANFFVSIDDCQEEVVPIDFYIPEGFSPNADGINDLFVIRGINDYQNNAIIIYNRWGNKVYEVMPYINGWDGKCTFGVQVGTDELPTGTYFYLLNLGNGSAVIKGWIYLNR